MISGFTQKSRNSGKNTYEFIESEDKLSVLDKRRVISGSKQKRNNIRFDIRIKKREE